MNPVLPGLAANPALPPDLVDPLIATGDPELVQALARRDDLTRAQAHALFAIDETCAWPLAEHHTLEIDPAVQPEAALAALSHGRGQPDWARLLAADPAYRVRLAECPDLPSDVQEDLATDPDIEVVAEFALWAPAPLAARLANHPHAEVRSALAANEATPPDVLAALITGDDPPSHCLVCDREEIPFVHDPNCPRTDCDLPPGAACDGSHQSTVHTLRWRALENPSTPTSAAMRFADAPSMLLRCALASRPDLTPEAAAQLATSREPGVLADLAENPALPEDLLRTFATSTDPMIRRAAANNPRLPLDVLETLATTAKIGLALLPRVAAATPAEVTQLATSPNPAVRMLVAARRDLPPATRDALANDPDAKVVKAIAPHPGLSEPQLRAMLDRHGSRVAAHVAANPDATSAVLEHITTLTPVPRKALRRIAAHPATQPATITRLLDAADPRVSEAAATNPSLPPAEFHRRL